MLIRVFGKYSLSKTVFRCWIPFAFGTHISLETSVWAYFSWKNFYKHIGSIGLWQNYSGNLFWGKLLIFVKVIFNFSQNCWLIWRVKTSKYCSTIYFLLWIGLFILFYFRFWILNLNFDVTDWMVAISLYFSQ